MSPAISAAFAEREGQALSNLHSAGPGQMDAGTKSSVDLEIKPVTSLRPVCTISTLVLTSQKHTPAALSSKVQPSNLEGGTSSRPASLIAKSQNNTVCSPTLTLFDTDTPLPSPSLWSPARKGPTSPVRDRRHQSGSATSLSEQCWTPVGLRPRGCDTDPPLRVHEDKGGQREGLLSLVDMLSIIEPEEKSSQTMQCDHLHQACSIDGNASRLLKRTYSLTLSRQHRAQSRAGKRSEDTLYEDRDALGLPQPTPSHSPTKTSWPLMKAYDALRDKEASVIPFIKAAAATVGRIPARETQRALRGSARNLTRQGSLRIFSRPGTPGRSI
ncbi:hypothetical protein BCV69DRAFT_77977 [Microstroma glucosiphilum]|uniref:Uncharacterized protein n=1 Tax=Pseudomicrostroma glucosiphilum TaxID=1684307 RepID=A0A316TZZ0_9BASI|nr:hypothetical protein BCV69DRAFT_77977 [Pseudomicrostroma glucosiphilum]PWN18188.1 hypothetical protein BCV69DRAFT_77977 [Pseudomicrostroma glucosiphilum]